MTHPFDHENDEPLDETQIGDNHQSPDQSELPGANQLLNHGRYRTERILGSGGFGTVYLARDTQLKRLVAIKIPHRAVGSNVERREAYLAEARIVAQLEHPGIVPVFDVGSEPDVPCFIVSRYVTGDSLSAVIKRGRMPVQETVRIIAAIAEALHFAHKRGIVHLDIKPGNILLSEGLTPYVVDFGLALRDEDPREHSVLAGTAMYMSPEQARGEGHRIDGRTDVYSLGVVLYEMLSGRKPYRASSVREMLQEVMEREPRPLRQLDETLPRELDRICAKAMAKRASDRYSTAFDFADDLKTFALSFQTSPASRTSPLSGTGPVLESSRGFVAEEAAGPKSESQKSTSVSDHSDRSRSSQFTVVPKGLRSFDRDDSEFFMDLLPGPRDRSGVPASLQFWRKQIESSDPESTFEVGLIYGPSGSGKSSFLKAGLIPLLSTSVRTVYVDCAAGDIEKRLSRGLRTLLSQSSPSDDLLTLMSALRRGNAGHGTKTLIILDQFEQWLHRRPVSDGGELVSALRQCDGLQLQCILTVRDDFWMGVTSLLSELEIPLIQGRNNAPMDLFPVRHAKKVLTAFGQAFGELPTDLEKLTEDQQQFLTKAVESLAVDGKIICVHLTMFAEMMKERPWNITTLTQVGGTAGLGVTFLEDTFSSTFAAPRNRMHADAARAVLNSLLPSAGTDIRGHMRSADQLLGASGYSSNARAFQDLIQLLDQDLRLISPTDNSSIQSLSETSVASREEQKYYQITHDYLIHPLREWLHRKQRETRRGRAQLFLTDRAALWSAQKEKALLPGIINTLRVISLTDRGQWTGPESEMMTGSVRHHLARISIAAVAVLLLLLGAFRVYDTQRRNNTAALINGQIDGLKVADISRVGELLPPLSLHGDAAKEAVIKMFAEGEAGSNEKLYGSLALLQTDPNYSEEVRDYLKDSLLNSSPSKIQTLGPVVESFVATLRDELQPIAENAKFPSSVRLHAVCLMLSAGQTKTKYDGPLLEMISEQLVSALPSERPSLEKLLTGISSDLTELLSQIALDETRPDNIRFNACSALVGYWDEFPDKLLPLLKVAPESQYQLLIEVLRPKANDVVKLCTAQIKDQDKNPTPGMQENRFASCKANLLLCMLNYGSVERSVEEALLILRADQNPQLHSYIVQRMATRGCNRAVLFSLIESESDSNLLSTLIKCLSFYTVPPDDELELKLTLLTSLLENPDAGVHSAAAFLVGKWSKPGKPIVSPLIKSPEPSTLLADGKASTSSPTGTNRCTWIVDEFAGEMAVLPITEFTMGSPDSEVYRYARENLHKRRVGHTVAVALRETTREQYNKFLDWLKENDPESVVETTENELKLYSESDLAPRGGLTWYMAARYCNWLSRQAGKEPCYKPDADEKYALGMGFEKNHLQLSGYRMPTEAEWEYACRAGTETSRFCGSDDSTLQDYAWFIDNSEIEAKEPGTKPKNPDGNGLHNVATRMPNSFGLFDTMGNAFEWCDDSNIPYRDFMQNTASTVSHEIVDDRDDNQRVKRGGSFGVRVRYCRSACRDSDKPSSIDGSNGLRIVRTIVPSEEFAKP